MNGIIESLTGMNVLTDQVIASDLLIAAKSGIRNYAAALTETASPHLRPILRRHLDEAIATHERVSNYMISKGWYLPHDVEQQLQIDMQAAQTAMNLSKQ